MTVISRQEAQALLSKPKRAKYGNRKVMIDGILFDSIKEGKRWQELRLLEKAGEISHLVRQPKFFLYGKDGPVLIRSNGYPNGRRAYWKGDFAYFDYRLNKRICEDVKGFRTQIFILKKAVVEACYPGLEIVEI